MYQGTVGTCVLLSLAMLFIPQKGVPTGGSAKEAVPAIDTELASPHTSYKIASG